MLWRLRTPFIAGPAQLGRRFGHAFITLYRYTLSPFIAFDCRHLPTCSAYADEAIERFGLWAGSWLAIARLSRCRPFGTSGLDFVPASLPERSRWYLPWRYALWRSTNPGTIGKGPDVAIGHDDRTR
jgi:putative membrane protein insertion efficiency factor